MMTFIPFFIGSFTKKISPEIIGKGDGIYTVLLNDDTGELRVINHFKTINPSYLALSEDDKFLYCNTEVSASNHPKVQSYRVLKDFSLEFLNEQPISGGFPCYIEKYGNSILIACYETGNILRFTTDANGKLMECINNHQHYGTSTNELRQEAPHAHQVLVHPNKKQVFACDLGIDTIKAYRFTKDNLLADKKNDIPVSKGGGPRHMVFNKSGTLAYVINELSGNISILKHSGGSFTQIGEKNSLPLTYDKTPSSSAIRIHPNQPFLYVANRTIDTITIFRIIDDTIALVDYQYTMAKELREFNITPNGKWLIACHQNSHDTIVYKIESDGKLTEKYRTKEIKTPVCVVFTKK